jgi:hypothetical protein
LIALLQSVEIPALSNWFRCAKTRVVNRIAAGNQ